jgi:hypothetical protein
MEMLSELLGDAVAAPVGEFELETELEIVLDTVGDADGDAAMQYRTTLPISRSGKTTEPDAGS